MATYCDLYGVCVVHDTHAVQVTIRSHSTNEALHIFHSSTVNQTCNF